ncbi:hypothetical protein ABK040_002135 [Willaertia magna]
MKLNTLLIALFLLFSLIFVATTVTSTETATTQTEDLLTSSFENLLEDNQLEELVASTLSATKKPKKMTKIIKPKVFNVDPFVACNRVCYNACKENSSLLDISLSKCKAQCKVICKGL